MTDNGDANAVNGRGGPRYCGVCGQVFADADGASCPNCGAAWSPFVFDAVAPVAALLGEMRRLREAGVLDEASYDRARDLYEGRLAALRAQAPVAGASLTGTAGWPARAQARRPGLLRRILDPGAAGAAVVAGPAEAGPAVPNGPPAPRTTLADWAAARQADILLYLGAFLLAVAALIFVGYQGEALSGAVRFAVLLAYTVGMLALGLLLPRWERVREAGPVFLGLGALLVPVNVVALRTQVLGDGALPEDVLVLLGAAAAGGLYLLLALRGYGRLYFAPAGLALLVAWGALLAMLEIPMGWFGAWYAGGAGVIAIVAGVVGPVPRRRLVGLAMAVMAVSVVVAHLIALAPDAPVGQLPVAYGACLSVAVAFAVRRQATLAWAALPALGGMLGLTLLHARGVAVVWWSYPLLGAVLLVVATERWWSARPALRAIGWPYALAGAAGVPVLFTAWYEDRPAHGVAGFGVAALIYLVAALRAGDDAAPFLRLRDGERSLPIGRWLVARAAVAFLYVAAAYLNARLGVTEGDRAWIYAAIGLACWLGLAAAGPRRPARFALLAPAGVVATGVAAALAREEAGRAALILALGAMAVLASFATTRRPALMVVAAAALAAALAFVWRWRGYDAALLPVAYAGMGAILAGVLTPRRGYARDEAAWSVAALSWGPWLLAIAAAVVLLERRDMALPLDAPLTRTREWYALVGVVGAAGAAVVLEGVRLRRGWVVAAGSAGLLAALLLGIAIARPGNVQAYTLPAGAYLIGLGFAWRRSPALMAPHLYAFEAAMIAGMALAVLPAAAQALDPGGGRYGLELIAIGLLLLAAGLAVNARWLVVGGVLTLTGVGVRWLLADSAVPYWLTLGVVGMALLGVGTLLLFERERWDRARARIRRWWAAGAA